MDRHCENARAIVAMLAEHPAVSRVLYPGLPMHPGHDVARRQMHDFGGMVSFVAAGGEAAALAIVAETRLFTLAESLGAVESLIEHPARMTHLSAADSPLAVDPGLVRCSVGIETVGDLVDDFRGALDAVATRQDRGPGWRGRLQRRRRARDPRASPSARFRACDAEPQQLWLVVTCSDEGWRRVSRAGWRDGAA